MDVTEMMFAFVHRLGTGPQHRDCLVHEDAVDHRALFETWWKRFERAYEEFAHEGQFLRDQERIIQTVETEVDSFIAIDRRTRRLVDDGGENDSITYRQIDVAKVRAVFKD